MNVVKVQCYRTFTSTETHGGGRGVKTRGEGGVWCQDPRGREVVVSADGVGLGGSDKNISRRGGQLTGAGEWSDKNISMVRGGRVV